MCIYRYIYIYVSISTCVDTYIYIYRYIYIYIYIYIDAHINISNPHICQLTGLWLMTEDNSHTCGSIAKGLHVGMRKTIGANIMEASLMVRLEPIVASCECRMYYYYYYFA